MERALRLLFFMGPLLFGIGFLAPLIAQSLRATGVEEVLGVSALLFALVVGGALGALATVRRRWI